MKIGKCTDCVANGLVWCDYCQTLENKNHFKSKYKRRGTVVLTCQEGRK